MKNNLAEKLPFSSDENLDLKVEDILKLVQQTKKAADDGISGGLVSSDKLISGDEITNNYTRVFCTQTSMHCQPSTRVGCPATTYKVCN